MGFLIRGSYTWAREVIGIYDILMLCVVVRFAPKMMMALIDDSDDGDSRFLSPYRARVVPQYRSDFGCFRFNFAGFGWIALHLLTLHCDAPRCCSKVSPLLGNEGDECCCLVTTSFLLRPALFLWSFQLLVPCAV